MKRCKCKTCGRGFLGARKHCRYCSWECRKQKSASEFPHLKSGEIGALNELKVSADLLEKGFEVFRSVSPNCSCDLIIKKGTLLYTVEVKTGYKNKQGKVNSNAFVRINNAQVKVIVASKELHYNGLPL